MYGNIINDTITLLHILQKITEKKVKIVGVGSLDAMKTSTWCSFRVFSKTV